MVRISDINYHALQIYSLIITLVYLSADFIPDGVGVVRASLNSLVIDIILFVSLMSDSDTAIHNQHNHGLARTASQAAIVTDLIARLSR